MVARVRTTSKYREKTKEPILAWEAEEIPPTLCATLSTSATSTQFCTPTPKLDGEFQGTVTPVKSDPEASGASNSLTSLSPMDSYLLQDVVHPTSTPTQLGTSNQSP
jgi:hypothetical protein